MAILATSALIRPFSQNLAVCQHRDKYPQSRIAVQCDYSFDVIVENEFLLQILKFQFIAQSHTLTEHVKRNLKNSSFCLPVLPEDTVNLFVFYIAKSGSVESQPIKIVIMECYVQVKKCNFTCTYSILCTPMVAFASLSPKRDVTRCKCLGLLGNSKKPVLSGLPGWQFYCQI